MVSLPDGEKISKTSLFVVAQLTNVTDRQRVTAIAALCIASHGKKEVIHDQLFRVSNHVHRIILHKKINVASWRCFNRSRVSNTSRGEGLGNLFGLWHLF